MKPTGIQSDAFRYMTGQQLSPRLFGLDVYQNPFLVVQIPHPLSSTRALAKIAGGRWVSKTVLAPDPQVLRVGNAIYCHPDTFLRIKRTLER